MSSPGVRPPWLDAQSEYQLCPEEERPGAEGRLYRARAGGVPLDLAWREVQGSQVSAAWAWHPEFFAGDFTFTIDYDGQQIWPEGRGEVAARVRTPVYKLTMEGALVGRFLGSHR